MEHLTITGGKSLNDGIWNPVSKSHYIKYYFLWNRKKYNCCFFWPVWVNFKVNANLSWEVFYIMQDLNQDMDSKRQWSH